MKRNLKDLEKNKVFYIDRWINKEHFRVFVYGKNEDTKLANSYEEYNKLISSGEWFTEKKDVPLEVIDCKEPKVLKIRKSKNGVGEY